MHAGTIYRSLVVARGRSLRIITPAGGPPLHVRGTLWVTEEGGTRAWVLASGQPLVIEGTATLIVRAVGADAVIALVGTARVEPVDDASVPAIAATGGLAPAGDLVPRHATGAPLASIGADALARLDPAQRRMIADAEARALRSLALRDLALGARTLVGRLWSWLRIRTRALRAASRVASGGTSADGEDPQAPAAGAPEAQRLRRPRRAIQAGMSRRFPGPGNVLKDRPTVLE